MILKEVIKHPSAWTRDEALSNKSWIYQFSEKHLEEIDAAFKKVDAQGLIYGQFSAEDFALGSFGEYLASIKEDVKNGRGLALLRGFPVKKYDLEQIKTIYWGFGCHLGTVIANNTKGEFVTAVTDAGDTIPSDENRRNNTTTRLLDPHTDPTDMVILLCIEKAKEGGMSSLSSSMTVHNEIVRNHPQHLEVLYSGFKRDLRGMGASRDPNEVSPPVPVYEYTNGNLNCSYVRGLILNGARKAGEELTEKQIAAIDTVEELSVRDDLRLDMMLEPGDIQMINNFRMFHARTSYIDHDDGRKRYLLRMWINFPDNTQLSPEFAAYNRSGVLPAISKQS